MADFSTLSSSVGASPNPTADNGLYPQKYSLTNFRLFNGDVIAHNGDPVSMQYTQDAESVSYYTEATNDSTTINMDMQLPQTYKAGQDFRVVVTALYSTNGEGDTGQKQINIVIAKRLSDGSTLQFAGTGQTDITDTAAEYTLLVPGIMEGSPSLQPGDMISIKVVLIMQSPADGSDITLLGYVTIQ